jgi:hypothetical protein
LTIREAATAAGTLSHNTLQRIETEDEPWAILTVEDLASLAKVYRVSNEHLLTLALGPMAPAEPSETADPEWEVISTSDGHEVHVPRTFFKPPRISKSNVRGHLVMPTWAMSVGARHRPETRPGTYILTSDTEDASLNDVVLAEAYRNDGTLFFKLLFLASEAGGLDTVHVSNFFEREGEQGALTNIYKLVLPPRTRGQASTPPDKFDNQNSHGSATEPDSETFLYDSILSGIEWMVLGPVIWSVR